MLRKTLTKNVYDCRASDLLNVVADVKSYSDFILFVQMSIFMRGLLRESKEHFSASLSINFKFTIENFETKVAVDRKLNTISISGNSSRLNL